jgi:hypothetical protein
MGKIEWETRDSSAPGVIAHIDVVDSNNFGTTFDMAFATGQSGSAIERMRIDSLGNVGIGTSSIASGGANTTNFNVHTPSATSAYFKLSNSSTGNSTSDGFDLIAASNGTAYVWNRENANMLFATNGTERMRIDSSGNLLVGTTSDYGKVTVIEALSGGQISVATSTSNNTTKFGGVTGIHYTSAEERVALVNIESNSSDSIARFGGGLSEYNTATQLRFFTAANNTTVTGTERMRIDSSGGILINTVGAKLYFQNSSGPAPYIQNAGTNNSDLTIATGGSERMRIDCASTAAVICWWGLRVIRVGV